MFAGLAILLSLAGCAATTSGRIQARINEKPEVFAKLTKQQKKDIKWGYVRPDYTPEMVYFAFGKPDQILTAADKDAYVWVFVDRASTNDDVALMSAIREAGGTGGKLAKMWGTHNDNFPKPPAEESKLFQAAAGPKSAMEAYTTIDATRELPTIWVAFKNDRVVNVMRVGGHDHSDKSGSLGG